MDKQTIIFSVQVLMLGMLIMTAASIGKIENKLQTIMDVIHISEHQHQEGLDK